MKFDVLHNFISPVTGRILADFNYVLVGNRQGIAIPSPILIDIRLDLIALKKRYNTLVTTDFIVGHPNEQIPNAQALVNLTDGFMFNTEGIVSTTGLIPIEGLPDLTNTYLWTGNSSNRPVAVQTIILNNMPNLTFKRIWRGNVSSRPVEVDDLTNVESNLSGALSNIASIFSTLSSLQSLVNGLESTVADLETGLASIGGWAAILIIQLQVLGLIGDVASLSSRMNTAEGHINDILAALPNIYDELGNIYEDIDFINTQITEINGDIADISTRIDNLSATFVGDVQGSGLIANPINLELMLTLDQIKKAEDTVDLNNNKIINLVSDDVEQLDALNAKFLWDLMHDNVGVVYA